MQPPELASRPRTSAKWARRLAVVLLVLVVLIIVVRLVIDPIAAHETRKALARAKGVRGDFAAVHVGVFPPGYTITRLKLIREPGGSWEEPLFYARAIHVALDWRRLFHRHLAGSVRVESPKVTLAPPAAQATAAKGAGRAPDLSEPLEDVVPLDVERVAVFHGQILYRDESSQAHPEVWIHDLALAAENLATRRHLAGARPATVSARGVVGDSGRLNLFVSADPLASPLAFAGRFEVVGLRLAELYRVIEPKTELQTPGGTLDLFAEFEAKNGRITGGIKPVLKNVEVRAAEPGVWDRIKAWFANLGVKLASDRVPGRNAVATTVPIEGRLAAPDVQLWPAVLGVVRNAFVQGLASGFSRLPPPEAPKREGKLEQAKHALEKSTVAPKAQPTTRPKGGGQ